MTAPVPASDPARPDPKAGQVWSAPSRLFGGKRFVLITEVRARGTENNYVNAVECGPKGGSVKPTPEAQFRGLPISIIPIGGTMPPPYVFEAS